MMRFFLGVVLCGLIILCCSCNGMERSYSFEKTSDFKKSEIFNKWVPDIIPEESEKIEVWYDIDTNLVRVEFLYRGSRPFLLEDMRPLNISMKGEAVKSYPHLGAGEKISTIQFKCRRQEIAPDAQPREVVVYSEVEFVGDTGKVVYYWNTHLDETYDKVCL